MVENEIILFGDFNIDLMKSNNRWTQIYENFGLYQLIDKPTRITASSETLIDHIYVSAKQNIAEICSTHTGCSDHMPVCITWLKKGTKIPKPGHKVITYRSFAKFNKDSFLHDLALTPLYHVYQYTDPNEGFKLWQKIFH